MKPQYVFVTVGCPASGKSAFYHKVAEDHDWGFGEVPVYISSDSIREELYGNESVQGDSYHVFSLLRHRAKSYLDRGHSVYLDATHIKSNWREYALELAKEYDIPCVALFFDVSFWTLIRRDFARKRRVGLWVLTRYYFGLHPPTEAEGFSRVFRIDKTGQYAEF